MKIVDIADEIYRELATPSDLSIPAIAYWLRSNIGGLNNLIHTEYTIRDYDLELVNTDGVEIADNEKTIFKKMYMIHFYDQKLRANMVSLTTDTVLSVRDGDSSVTKLNKNEVNKSIAAVKNQEYMELSIMVGAYKSSKGVPRQVVGDDTSSIDTTDQRDSQITRIRTS